MNAHCSPERLETRKHVQTTAETRLKKSRGRLDASLPPRVGCGRVGCAQTSFSVVFFYEPEAGHAFYPRSRGNRL